MNSVQYIQHRLMGDAHFLYTAFAPVARNCRDPENRQPASDVLVKVGISTVPMNRLIDIHCNSPFRVDMAAFAPAGGKKTALRAESRILDRFREHKTRGEWLLLPCEEAVKREFALRSKAILADVTGRPTQWTRVTGNEIARYMMERMHASAA